MTPISFTLTLRPAQRTGPCIEVIYCSAIAPKTKIIQATSVDQVVRKIQEFAQEHETACAISARIEKGRRKPSGFDAAMQANQHFNLDTPDTVAFHL